MAGIKIQQELNALKKSPLTLERLQRLIDLWEEDHTVFTTLFTPSRWFSPTPTFISDLKKFLLTHKDKAKNCELDEDQANGLAAILYARGARNSTSFQNHNSASSLIMCAIKASLALLRNKKKLLKEKPHEDPTDQSRLRDLDSLETKSHSQRKLCEAFKILINKRSEVQLTPKNNKYYCYPGEKKYVFHREIYKDNKQLQDTISRLMDAFINASNIEIGRASCRERV